MTSSSSPFAGGGFAGGGFAGKSGGKGKKVKVSMPNPFADLPESSNLEESTSNEVAALKGAAAGFRERMRQEKNRFDLAVDAGFWTGICFRSSEDLSLFFDALGTVELYEDQHLDGYKLCEKLGLNIDWVNRN